MDRYLRTEGGHLPQGIVGYCGGAKQTSVVMALYCMSWHHIAPFYAVLYVVNILLIGKRLEET